MFRANSDAKDEAIVIHVTPDQGWAWVISIACALINGITFGLLRSYGVLFFTLLNKYNLSRESASWPVCLCTTFTHLSGPVAGILLSRYSMRTIVSLGTIISAIGIILCYFTDSIVEITIYIGVIQGFGIGLSFMQTPVILAQYFQKFRATATAISYAGGTIGSFIFPPILEYLLAEYGLKGTYLIIGAIMLNALPFALLLRPAIPGHKVNKLFKEVHKQFSVISDSRKGKKRSQKKESFVVINSHPKRNQMHSVIVGHMCRCHTFPLETIELEDKSSSKDYNNVTKEMNESSEQLEQNMEKLNELRSFISDYECICIENQKYFDQSMVDVVNDKACQTDTKTSGLKRNWIQIKTVISNPLYLILCITHVSFQWAWMTHQMVIIDFSIDRGMSTSQAVVLLSCFAIADLFGRLASGLVADKHLVRKRNIVSICILLIGVLIFMTPTAKTFRILLVMTIALGFVSGSIIVLFSILTMEYVGLQRLPIALGTSAFTVGISTLVRPIVVGYFRDTFQSYDGLFHFIGVLALLAALLWLSEPFARLWVARRRKYGYGGKVSVV